MRDRVDGFFIQPQAEALVDSDVADVAAGIHFDDQDDHALMFRMACLFGKFRIHLVNQLRRGDTAAAINTETWGARLRVADPLAASMVADAVRAVAPERAGGQMAERIANGSAGIVDRDIEGDGDGQ